MGISPLNYTGNKSCIAPYLLDIMHPHTGYLEVFCGSAELFLRKEPCQFELLNDYKQRGKRRSGNQRGYQRCHC